jgi:hypothetical protein
LILRLSHRTNEALVHVYEVYGREKGQKYFKGQDSWIVLHGHEVPVLKYVREHQELQENGSP